MMKYAVMALALCACAHASPIDLDSAVSEPRLLFSTNSSLSSVVPGIHIKIITTLFSFFTFEDLKPNLFARIGRAVY